MKRLFLSDAARSDMEDIWDYTSERWGTVQAESYSDRIAEAFVDLCAGRATSRSAQDVRPLMRTLLVGRHIIYFRATPERIEIVRVLHERMDPGRHV